MKYLPILAAVLWGLDYAIGERLFTRLSVYGVMMTQYLVGAVACAVLGYDNFRSDVAALSGTTLVWFIAGIVIANAAMLAIAFSVKHLNATVAGLIEISYPLFVILFSWLLFDSVHLTPKLIIGGTLVAAGIVVMS